MRDQREIMVRCVLDGAVGGVWLRGNGETPRRRENVWRCARERCFNLRKMFGMAGVNAKVARARSAAARKEYPREERMKKCARTIVREIALRVSALGVR